MSRAFDLRVEKLTKTFGRFTALADVSFDARKAEFITVLGPSGCGKTTLLRLIAGLERQNSGTVFFQDRDVTDLPVSRRNVGIVFQSYALFPNLNARQNIAYGLRSRNMSRDEIRKRAAELLELVGLPEMGEKYPAQLSGGQQQRVALARAMALSPDILLLDEPLSALDAKVRLMLRGEIRRLQQRLNVTTIMVTHDQEEALTMADRILVMDQGRLVQNGTPHEIYDRPATPFVASFIGAMNFIRDALHHENGIFQVGDHRLQVQEQNGHRLEKGRKAAIAIRPEDVMVHQGNGDTPNTLQARVLGMEYRGPVFRVAFHLPIGAGQETTIESDISAEKIRRLNIREQAEIPIHLPTDRLHVYPN